MNELASLLPILLYALVIVLLAALMGRLIDGNDGPSLASLVGGHQDLPWPRGVQEEEPVRWNMAALSRRESNLPRSGLDRQAPVVPGFAPRHAATRSVTTSHARSWITRRG